MEPTPAHTGADDLRQPRSHRRDRPGAGRRLGAVERLRVERRGAARISSIAVQRKGGGAAEELTADLIIDASGRGSKVPGMLARAGVALPEETVVDSGTWYSTRWFKSAPGHELPPSAWWKAVLLVPTIAGPGALMRRSCARGARGR